MINWTLSSCNAMLVHQCPQGAPAATGPSPPEIFAANPQTVEQTNHNMSTSCHDMTMSCDVM